MRSRPRAPQKRLAYSIQELGEHVTVAAESGESITLPRKTFFQSVRLRYAMTYASAQGVTVEGLLALHDTSHPHFRLNMLYVGASRARGVDSLVIY